MLWSLHVHCTTQRSISFSYNTIYTNFLLFCFMYLLFTMIQQIRVKCSSVPFINQNFNDSAVRAVRIINIVFKEATTNELAYSCFPNFSSKDTKFGNLENGERSELGEQSGVKISYNVKPRYIF